MMTQGVKESVIRLMTRLSIQYNAVNLSQGFPNEPPPTRVRLALAQAVLSGNTYNKDVTHTTETELSESLQHLLVNDNIHTKTDVLNQYSPPMGRVDVRQAVSNYYKRLYEYDVSEDDITITLGATEAVASALRSISSPGDKVAIFEPYHELYPSQCALFYLEPSYVTLKVNDGEWKYDYNELKDAISESKAVILNSPHNPTGKVFTHKEMKEIVDLCIEHNTYIITDEIYEWMTCSDENNSPREHILIPQTFAEAKDLTLVCNSMGKSASATGWRLGWCLHPPHLSDIYRGIHDQLAVMSPHPMQYASLVYFSLPDTYFKEELRERYKSRVDLLAAALAKVGFGVVQPEGAYYLFVNYRCVEQLKDLSPMEAAMYLIEKVGVAVVPGDNFYGRSADGEDYLRFAACRSLEDITKAIELLNRHLNPHK